MQDVAQELFYMPNTDYTVHQQTRHENKLKSPIKKKSKPMLDRNQLQDKLKTMILQTKHSTPNDHYVLLHVHKYEIIDSLANKKNKINVTSVCWPLQPQNIITPQLRSIKKYVYTTIEQTANNIYEPPMKLRASLVNDTNNQNQNQHQNQSTTSTCTPNHTTINNTFNINIIPSRTSSQFQRYFEDPKKPNQMLEVPTFHELNVEKYISLLPQIDDSLDMIHPVVIEVVKQKLKLAAQQYLENKKTFSQTKRTTMDYQTGLNCEILATIF
jgi:hypothetical protein